MRAVVLACLAFVLLLALPVRASGCTSSTPTLALDTGHGLYYVVVGVAGAPSASPIPLGADTACRDRPCTLGIFLYQEYNMFSGLQRQDGSNNDVVNGCWPTGGDAHLI